MSRTKKSRKPGAGSASVPKPKASKAELEKAAPRKPKKKVGKPAGNRQQEATVKKTQQEHSNKNKDPRIGSKKPIDLGGTVKTQSVQKQKPKAPSQSPIAAIRKVEPVANIEQQIEQIENDPVLLAIVDKQDLNTPLSAEEVDYYNTQMERHQALSDQLDDNDTQEDVTEQTNSLEDEDAMWDKLDSSDLSKFE